MLQLISEAVRVLKLAKKPNAQEFKQMVKITGLGFLVLGLIGYLFHLIIYVLRMG